MVKEELTQQNIPFYWSLGIQKLRSLIHSHETKVLRSSNNAAFSLQFHEAYQWLEPAALNSKEKKVRFALKKIHIEFVRNELRERNIMFEMNNGIKTLQQNHGP